MKAPAGIPRPRFGELANLRPAPDNTLRHPHFLAESKQSGLPDIVLEYTLNRLGTQPEPSVVVTFHHEGKKLGTDVFFPMREPERSKEVTVEPELEALLQPAPNGLQVLLSDATTFCLRCLSRDYGS
jgi:hypothetical protein